MRKQPTCFVVMPYGKRPVEDVEIDFAVTGGSGYVSIHSALGTSEADVDGSSFATLADEGSLAGTGTSTLTIGPGLGGWDAAMAAGEIRQQVGGGQIALGGEVEVGGPRARHVAPARAAPVSCEGQCRGQGGIGRRGVGDRPNACLSRRTNCDCQS